MAINNNIPNFFDPRVPGTASMPITYDSTPNLFNIDQAQVQQAINQKKIDDDLAEQEQRKRADRSMRLKQFADTMLMVNANQSGNYGASKIFSDRIAQRKALAEQKQKEALLKTQQDEFVKNNPQYRNAIQLNTLFPGLKLPTAKDRRIVKGVDERQYYADTEELVLPNIKPVQDSSDNFANRDKVRDDYLKSSGEFVKVRDAYDRILSTGAKESSPAGDLALIFNYMKMLDPGSVVRESEFANAAASGSFGQRVKAAYERYASGERLTDEMRKDFMTQAGNLFAGQQSIQTNNMNDWSNIAEAEGMDASKIVLDLSKSIKPKIFKFNVKIMSDVELANLDITQFSEEEQKIIEAELDSRN